MSALCETHKKIIFCTNRLPLEMFLGVTRCDKCVIILSSAVKRLSSDTSPRWVTTNYISFVTLCCPRKCSSGVIKLHQLFISMSPDVINLSSFCHQLSADCHQTPHPVSNHHQLYLFCHALLPLNMHLGVIRCHQPVIILSPDVIRLSSSTRLQ